MKVAILKEKQLHEGRVAASPDTVKKMKTLGLDVIIESGAGLDAVIPDQMFAQAGAEIAPDVANTLAQADIVLKVQRPLPAIETTPDELKFIKRDAVLIGLLAPYQDPSSLKQYADAGITTFALELLPRITRAQSMDVLSSQANVAGYKAVLDAASHFGRSFPMMITAAGTIPPAHCFVMGAGVAGLQAIATAKRLGAVVSATDVRPAAKEEVMSLGAKFIAVEDEEFKQAQAKGGYAKQMSEEYKQKQAQLIKQTITKQDIVITTAAVFGKKAPILVTNEMIATMKPGSLLIDLAIEQGGNIEASEANQTVTTDNGVTILGYTNMPSRLAVAASSLYARNVLAFLTLLIDKETNKVTFNWDDELIKNTALTHNGRIIHSQFTN